MSLCEHGDVRAACLDCLTGKPPERGRIERPVDRDGPVWAARFPGHCSGCNTAIHERQTICRMTDGTYRHERCA